MHMAIVMAGEVVGHCFDKDSLAKLVHELRQPLNVVSLSAGNLRARLAGSLDADQAAYLHSRLDRITEQVARASALLDSMSDAIHEQG